jgi:hypothetical protein
MLAVSFAKETLNITIHNQYPSSELISPVYFSTGTTCHVSSSNQTDNDTVTKASFGIDSKQDDFKCALLYKLQKKHTNTINDQLNNSTESVKDIVTSIHLLVIWDVEDYNHNFCVCLVEFTNDFAWNEDKLWSLYWEYNNQFYEDYKSNIITWSMHDGSVIRTKSDVTYGSDYESNIIISDGIRGYDMEESMRIDPKRLVLLLSILIVLIYALSVFIPLSFKLNIHNQYSNVDLVSLTYVTDDNLECHRPPGHKVYSGDTMRSGFIIKSYDISHGVLIYRLQRKQPHESTEINEDASNVVHLLVVWEISESKKLYTDVLLVEHDKGFDWDKDNLREFYSKNINRFRLCPDSATETWSLDDKVALMSTFKIMNNDYKLDITISEVGRDNDTRIPVHIDLKK